MTIKELAEIRRIEREREWNKKYPNGSYFIQFVRHKEVWNSDRFCAKLPTIREIDNGDIETILAKETRARTSNTAYRCLVVGEKIDKNSTEDRGINGYHIHSYVTNTWGCVRRFSDRNKFLVFLREYKVPEDKINTFLKLESEGN